MIPFPNINPVALSLGPIAITWYGISYAVSMLIGWRYARYLTKFSPDRNLNLAVIDELLSWMILGIILGGRLGYVCFYEPLRYLQDPFSIVAVWKGGMSFHGGLLGVILGVWLFSRRYKVNFYCLMDIIACLIPIGLFLGRLANFINGELYGRPTGQLWGMIFPNGGPLLRHPSQLYEAALEGILLFIFLNIIALKYRALSYVRLLSGAFLLGYGTLRIFVECFREADENWGYLLNIITMGQVLSLPMVFLGVIIIYFAIKK